MIAATHTVPAFPYAEAVPFSGELEGAPEPNQVIAHRLDGSMSDGEFATLLGAMASTTLANPGTRGNVRVFFPM